MEYSYQHKHGKGPQQGIAFFEGPQIKKTQYLKKYNTDLFHVFKYKILIWNVTNNYICIIYVE